MSVVKAVGAAVVVGLVFFAIEIYHGWKGWAW